MLDKVYLGSALADLDVGEKSTRITRVNLLVDSDHMYTAGDDSGRTIEKNVPWASQLMANAVLASLRNYDYQPFSGTDALLDPAAEMGDGITVGGIYSVLAQKDVTYGKLSTANISAPSSDEVEEEYPYTTKSQRQSQRQLAQTYSYITKTAENIREGVVDEVNGKISEIEITIDGITSRVEDVEVGSSEIKQTVSGIESRVTGVEGSTSSISQSMNRIATQVNGLEGSYTKIEQTINSITLTASNSGTSSTITLSGTGITAKSATINFTGLVTFSDLSGYGTTSINGANLMTGTVTASNIEGSTIYLLNSPNNYAGYITLTNATSGAYAVTLHSNAAVKIEAGNGNAYISSSYGSYIMLQNDSIQVSFANVGNSLRPGSSPTNYGGYHLGDSSHLWDDIYAAGSIIKTSDASMKHDIEPIPEKYIDMLDMVQPVRYKYNDGQSGRYHTGFIANEVKDAMDKNGVDSTEFGGFVATTVENGKYVFMLRYDEFIALLLEKIRRMDKRLKVLEGVA